MKKIVVKIGSSVIAPKGKLDSKLVSMLVKDIVSVEKKGYKVILVSSGAIACGLNKLGYKRKPNDTHSLMAISSVGQIILMDVFNDKFKKYKKTCAQILITWDDFDDRRRFINVRKTIDKLLSMGIIPIINENDAVSFEEIKLGDNDCISARVADLVEAQRLIILSDVDGLFDGDRLVEEVSVIDEKVRRLIKKKDTTHTAGGMQTKLQAAAIAMNSGIKTHIASGRKKNIICSTANDQSFCTVFLPSQKAHNARKRWIAFSKKPKGKIFIDKGAQEALLLKGKSLLAVGIIKCEGNFNADDAVHIVDEKGALLGYALANYDKKSLQDTKNKRYEKEVVHRNNFVKAFQE